VNVCANETRRHIKSEIEKMHKKDNEKAEMEKRVIKKSDQKERIIFLATTTAFWASGTGSGPQSPILTCQANQKKMNGFSSPGKLSCQLRLIKRI